MAIVVSSFIAFAYVSVIYAGEEPGGGIGVGDRPGPGLVRPGGQPGGRPVLGPGGTTGITGQPRGTGDTGRRDLPSAPQLGGGTGGRGSGPTRGAAQINIDTRQIQPVLSREPAPKVSDNLGHYFVQGENNQPRLMTPQEMQASVSRELSLPQDHPTVQSLTAVRLQVGQAYLQHGDTVLGGANRIGFVEAGIEMVRDPNTGRWSIQEWKGVTVDPQKAAQVMHQLQGGLIAANSDRVLIAVAAGDVYATVTNAAGQAMLAVYEASLGGISLGNPGGSGSIASYWHGDERFDLRSGTYAQFIKENYPTLKTEGLWAARFCLG